MDAQRLQNDVQSARISVLKDHCRNECYREGEEVKGIYFILHGKVKVDMTWGKKTYILRLAADGQILGHRGFGIDDIYPINAVTLEPTTVCFIPTGLFKTLLRTNQDFLYTLTFFYADELKRTERRMHNLAQMPVKGRIAESLILIRDAFGKQSDGTLNYALSRKDIASLSGTTYETVIRMLTELSQDGCIELNTKKIRLLNESGLESYCGHLAQ